MRVLYAIYAAVMIYFLWNATGDTTTKDVVIKVTFALWCAGLVLVVFKIKHYGFVALSALVPVLGFLLYQTVRRVGFIIEHGGMDCATCDASPLAFLIGWLTEGFFLVPGVVLSVWLLRSLKLKSVQNEI